MNQPARVFTALIVCTAMFVGCGQQEGGNQGKSVPKVAQNQPIELSDEELENLVRRSYQYVAMFNVNNKFALDQEFPSNTGGYNRSFANTELMDHTVQAIARPNNDTLYAGAMIDVTEEPMVLKLPVFDSVYVSLMVTGYDHYVNIPLSTASGDFSEPSSVLFYSERTPNYDGAPVEGVDHIFELTGDFASAILRVMPHAADPERLERNRTAMREIKLVSLSEFQGTADTDPDFLPWGSPPVVRRNLTLKEDVARFPEFGSDFEIYEERFLDVMQFVFNHTTFDAADPIDQALLAAFEPLGIVPGKAWDPATAAKLDGTALRDKAEEAAREALSMMADAGFMADNILKLFQPKGEMELEFLTLQSVVGPIGQPAREAVYPPVVTDDGTPMNARFDYEIVMAPENMPPARAFWSATLYDNANGFFIPNERRKYSVGENAGYKLDQDGGIRIVVAAEQPEGVPEENWLPINRRDLDIDIIMRLYSPDLERFARWSPPVARKLNCSGDTGLVMGSLPPGSCYTSGISPDPANAKAMSFTGWPTYISR